MTSITDLIFLGNNTFLVGGIFYTLNFSFLYDSKSKDDKSYSGYISELY